MVSGPIAKLMNFVKIVNFTIMHLTGGNDMVPDTHVAYICLEL